MLDAKIVGGLVVDGTGREPYRADIGIKDGVIVEVDAAVGAGGIETEAAETIDATGRIVTPGFVDIHTHYDGQVTWDPLLEPSSLHGVTTVVSGNCGVGFAPVRPGTRGMAHRPDGGRRGHPRHRPDRGHDLGLGVLPRVPRRRGTARAGRSTSASRSPTARCAPTRWASAAPRNEPATPEDIEAMARLVQEAVEAGALGFSTSRTLGHRAMDGEPVPGTFAAEDELFGLGRAMAAAVRPSSSWPRPARPARTWSPPSASSSGWSGSSAEIDDAGVVRAAPGRCGARTCGAS